MSFVSLGRGLIALVGLATAAVAADAKGAKAVVPPPFTAVRWFAASEVALARDGVATAGLTLGPESTTPAPGDTLTVLVQATEGDDVRQWAVIFTADAITSEEAKQHTSALTLYSNLGDQFDFAAGPLAAVKSRVIGPFTGTGRQKPKDLKARALANPQFLALGLYGVPALIARVKDAAAADPRLRGRLFTLNAGTTPFPRAVVADTQQAIGPFAVTASEQQAFVSSLPALVGLFESLMATDGLRDLVLTAVDIPWWSIATHRGSPNIGFQFLEPFESLGASEWGLPAGARAYAFGCELRIANKPALLFRMAVTPPIPPLHNTAGVIAISAMRPDGGGPRLMIQVMAGHPAGAARVVAQRQ